jgi:hypothetical protein
VVQKGYWLKQVLVVLLFAICKALITLLNSITFNRVAPLAFFLPDWSNILHVSTWLLVEGELLCGFLNFI